MATITDEKQQMEERHTQVVSDIHATRSNAEQQLREDFESKMAAKDAEMKSELNRLLGDKNSTVEDVTRKLEDIHQLKLEEVRIVVSRKGLNILADLGGAISYVW